MRDPYEVLGVPKTADDKTVKAAYRRLARELHPDLHPGDSKAETRFKEVAAAYDFLSDPEKKRRYDAGEIDAEGTPRMHRTYYRSYADRDSANRYTDSSFFRNFGDFQFFSQFFGDEGDGGRFDSMPRGRDTVATLELDFLDAAKGGVREITLSGGRRLKVTIPPGSNDGQILRLQGQGEPGPGGGRAGDLRIELKVRPHPTFRRDGDDIHVDLPVRLGEAVLGGKVEVPTIDGPVSLTIPKGSNTGTRLRLRGKGVPRSGGGRGDQYVTLQVVLPEPSDAEFESLVASWPAATSYRVRGRT